VLEEIRIGGLGVIDDATVHLSPGLTVVTGETGAGKTMLVTALGLLFGGRADVGRVRGGAAKAVVEGRLRLGDHRTGARRPEWAAHIRARAVDCGAEIDDDDSVVLARSVSADGRSRAHLGGRAVPVAVLAEVGEHVVTVHGQSDQLRMLRPAEQRAALDRFAGDAVIDLVQQHREAFRAWQAVVADLADRSARSRDRDQEADLLRFGLDEVASVDPQPGEDDALRAESSRLEHVDALRTAADTAHAVLSGDPYGSDDADVATLLGIARKALGGAAAADRELQPLAVRADHLAALVAELGADLASYADGLETDPARLNAVHERRAALATLTRKYGSSVNAVLEWAEQARRRLMTLDASDETLAALAVERDRLGTEVSTLAAALSDARRHAAGRLADAVSAELASLAMPDARVEVKIGPRDPQRGQPDIVVAGRSVAVGPDGVDEVEVRLVPHAGAPALPLQRGASGGELSRVMLAVEVAFAGSGGTPTMVFDEVDAGVGGRAAVEVGRRLARLARDHQVLVVTHLPQVAAFADVHVSVVKAADGSVSATGVRALDDAERARELSRMLAGLEDSELGVAHAGELLAVARAERELSAPVPS